MGNDTKHSELTALAGDAGTQVLDGAKMAVDDLEVAGITAKDASTEDAGIDPPAPDETPADEAEAEPVAGKSVDLAAIKEAVAKLAEDARKSDDETPKEDAGMVQLRELVAGLRQEVDELRADNAAHDVQVKALAEFKDLPGKFAALKAEHEQALEVISGLYDLVAGVYTGAKAVVIERNGQTAAHDADGAALQQQILTMVGNKGQSNGSGDYAVDRVFGATS